MKQKTLLFTAITAFSVLILSSYDDGPALPANGGNNRTGSAGSTANCTGSGCHPANNAATTAQVLITDTTSTSAITSYTPGKKYYLRVVGGSATLTKYGFQASTVKSSSTNTQAGSMSTGGSSTANTAIRTVGSIQIFEHSAPLTATVVAGAQVYGANCYWTAPAAGTGAVKVYAIINGVNGDAMTSGDAPNAAAVVTINEASSSVENTASNINFKVFPNPAVNNITITADGIGAGTCVINVVDLRGKLVSTQNAEAVNGTLNANINSSKWAAGIHMVQIQKEGHQKVIPVVKQ